jgi:hypothetical protein
MNWLIRLGQWWEKRKSVRRPELELAYETLNLQANHFNAQVTGLKNEIKEIKDTQQIPQTIAKELALIKARLDRLELLTGLKREPQAVSVKDAPRIG